MFGIKKSFLSVANRCFFETKQQKTHQARPSVDRITLSLVMQSFLLYGRGVRASTEKALNGNKSNHRGQEKAVISAHFLRSGSRNGSFPIRNDLLRQKRSFKNCCWHVGTKCRRGAAGAITVSPTSIFRNAVFV